MMLCDKINQCTADFLIPHESAITLFSDTDSDWWATPPSVWNLRLKWSTPFEKCQLQQSSAYNISTIRDNEKSSIMTNRKLAMDFPTSYICSVYVTPKSPKRWLKKRFFVFLTKIQFQSNKVCYTSSHRITVLEHASRGLSAIAELLVSFWRRAVD